MFDKNNYKNLDFKLLNIIVRINLTANHFDDDIKIRNIYKYLIRSIEFF